MRSTARQDQDGLAIHRPPHVLLLCCRQYNKAATVTQMRTKGFTQPGYRPSETTRAIPWQHPTFSFNKTKSNLGRQAESLVAVQDRCVV